MSDFKPWELTPEEYNKAAGWKVYVEDMLIPDFKAVAAAQLKKVVEWLEGDCPHYTGKPIRRFDCSECMAALKRRKWGR